MVCKYIYYAVFNNVILIKFTFRQLFSNILSKYLLKNCINGENCPQKVLF